MTPNFYSNSKSLSHRNRWLIFNYLAHKAYIKTPNKATNKDILNFYHKLVIFVFK